jgi:hypothetical protein
MPPRTPFDYEPAPGALIDALLQRLEGDPGSLDLHRELRTAALKRKAAGGPPAGTLARMWPLPNDPVGRLIHVERLWSLDPSNLDWLLKVAEAVEVCAAERPGTDFGSVRRWLRRLAQAARAVR